MLLYVIFINVIILLKNNVNDINLEFRKIMLD